MALSIAIVQRKEEIFVILKDGKELGPYKEMKEAKKVWQENQPVAKEKK